MKRTVTRPPYSSGELPESPARRNGASRASRRAAGAELGEFPRTHRSDGLRRSRPVLITGGAGFIGTNVAARLLSSGARVLIYDNLSRPGVDENLEWLVANFGAEVSVEVADVRDRRRVQAAVAQSSAVFHFAAQVAVTTSLVDPVSDFEVNARGTLNVLEACRHCAVPPPLLFTSTNKVYGDLSDIALREEGGRYVPLRADVSKRGIAEDHPLDFHSPYGCSKGAADQYVLDFARCYRLPAVVFRMSCIYGPHQQGTEDQGWVAHFARQFISSEPIILYGNGHQVRDILFVDDLVQAMTAAIERIERTAGRPFNVGGGPQNAVSLLQVVDELAQIGKVTPELRFADWRQGDQRYYVSNPQALREATGWRPSVTPELGLRRLYGWLRDHKRTAAGFRTATDAGLKQCVGV